MSKFHCPNCTATFDDFRVLALHVDREVQAAAPPQTSELPKEEAV